jgi:protein-tyrosine phosphatase
MPKRDKDGKTVLFICTANFFRSRYAEAYFNCLADWNKSPHRAVSAGISIDPNIGPISSYSLYRMVERGIDNKCMSLQAKKLYSGDVDAADVAVCVYKKEHKPMMELLYESVENQIIYWDIPDINEISPNQSLDLVEKSVDILFNTIHDKKWKGRDR